MQFANDSLTIALDCGRFGSTWRPNRPAAPPGPRARLKTTRSGGTKPELTTDFDLLCHPPSCPTSRLVEEAEQDEVGHAIQTTSRQKSMW